MLPSTIGPYEIRVELGRGGMAVVYQAYDPRLFREVAVKVLPREVLHDPEFRARFRREVAAVTALEHPAIVPVYEAGEHDGQPFMVMRLMTGSLAERLRTGPLPLPQVARVISRIAPALDAAHTAGLIHRDVKPDNILFDGDGTAYLADFGIVGVSQAATKLTHSGMIGTPDYMAPELTKPGGLTPLVDVYALGVLIFQMLTGRLPYEADTPLGTLVAHVTEPIPDPRVVRPELPSAIVEVLARALAKDPGERYQSAGGLADDLAAVAGGGTPTIRLSSHQVRPVATAVPSLPHQVAAPGLRPPHPSPTARRSVPLSTVILSAIVTALVVGSSTLAFTGQFNGQFNSSWYPTATVPPWQVTNQWAYPMAYPQPWSTPAPTMPPGATPMPPGATPMPPEAPPLPFEPTTTMTPWATPTLWGAGSLSPTPIP